MTTTARSIGSATASSRALVAAALLVSLAAPLALAAPPAFAQAASKPASKPAAKPAAPSAHQLSIQKQAEACFACHGAKGESQAALTPSLGGMPSFFVVAQLFLFRDGRRGKLVTPMEAIARGMSDDDLRAWGDLIAKLPPPAPPSRPADAARFARGRAIVEKQRCTSCHNPDFSGREQMPRLANQREDYLLKSMRDYKSGARIGYGSATMGEVLAEMRDADLADLAHFLAFLPARKN